MNVTRTVTVPVGAIPPQTRPRRRMGPSVFRRSPSEQERQLIERVKKLKLIGRRMTKEEIFEQKVSFVYGQMGHSSSVSQEQVREMLLKHAGEL